MGYYFQRVLNNNAIVATDDYDDEVVLFGRGIGVRCKRVRSYPVNPLLIEKIFENRQSVSWKYLNQLIKNTPYEYFGLMEHVIKEAENDLKYDFGDWLFLSLLDHVSFSVQREKEGEVIRNPLVKEIQQFYPNEYKAALRSIEILNNTVGSHLDENEASFLAFHYINAMSSINESDNRKTAQILQYCVEIIDSDFDINLDEESYYFYRFVSHVKYLIRKILKGEKGKTEEVVLSDFIKNQYTEEWACAMKIGDHIKEVFGNKNITDDETAYLTLHIVTMLKNNERIEK